MKNNKSNKSIPCLDLHGCKSDEVFDKVEEFINLHVKKSSNEIHIMTGKGTGIVQNEVKKYLKLAHYNWKYLNIKNKSENTGVLVIHLR